MAKKKQHDESLAECEPVADYCEDSSEPAGETHAEQMSTMAFLEMVAIREALVRLADQHMQTVRHRDLP